MPACSLYFTYGETPKGFLAIAAFLILINLVVMSIFLFFIGLAVLDGLLAKVSVRATCESNTEYLTQRSTKLH
jgi:hypothetical protein